MPICRHCKREFETDPAHNMGHRKYCYRLECIRKEKERAKAVKNAWYQKAKTQGYFKSKQRERKGIKPTEVEKICMRCKKKFISILGAGDSKGFGICNRCKQIASYHVLNDDFNVGVPGIDN